MSAMEQGTERAKLAREIHINTVCNYIGQYYVELGGCDAIVFTAGLGENDIDFRVSVCEKIEAALGVKLDKEGHACISSDMLSGLLSGSISIIHKPWKPEEGECYFFIDEYGLSVWDTWGDSYEDILLYKLGNLYKTKDAAEKDSAKWKAFYESDEVLEV